MVLKPWLIWPICSFQTASLALSSSQCALVNCLGTAWWTHTFWSRWLSFARTMFVLMASITNSSTAISSRGNAVKNYWKRTNFLTTKLCSWKCISTIFWTRCNSRSSLSLLNDKLASLTFPFRLLSRHWAANSMKLGAHGWKIVWRKFYLMTQHIFFTSA